MPKVHGVLSDLDDQKKEKNCKPKRKCGNKSKSKTKNIYIIKLSFPKQK